MALILLNLFTLKFLNSTFVQIQTKKQDHEFLRNFYLRVTNVNTRENSFFSLKNLDESKFMKSCKANSHRRCKLMCLFSVKVKRAEKISKIATEIRFDLVSINEARMI